MTENTSIASRFLAGFGAIALTLTLFVGSFATPHAATFAGVLA